MDEMSMSSSSQEPPRAVVSNEDHRMLASMYLQSSEMNSFRDIFFCAAC